MMQMNSLGCMNQMRMVAGDSASVSGVFSPKLRQNLREGFPRFFVFLKEVFE